MSDVIRHTPASKQGTTSDSMMVECTGQDRYLLVFINIVDANPADRGLTIDYNGTSLSRLQGRSYSANLAESEVWGLSNPAEGNHSLSWSFAGGISEYQILAIPLANVDQAAPVDSGDGSAGTGTSRSVALITMSDRCQLFSLLAANSSVTGVSPDSGEMEIISEIDSATESHVSEENEAATPAGSVSMGWSWSGSQVNAVEVVAIKPTANTILAAPVLALPITFPLPSGLVRSRPEALAVSLGSAVPIGRVTSLAENLNLTMKLLQPGLAFQQVVRLQAGTRRQRYSSGQRHVQQAARLRVVRMITEKRNE